MTPLDRVAQAIRITLHLSTERERQAACRAARAVLLALRVPSAGMIATAVQRVGDPSSDNWALGEKVSGSLGVISVDGETACAELARDWQAMIDAALEND